MTDRSVRRLDKEDPALPEILSLIRTAFRYMDGLIDPPSSVHLMTLDSLRAQLSNAELWAIGSCPSACMILTPQHDHLYIGKLATAPNVRGQGLARQLINHAQTRAKSLNLPELTLQTRVELTANHAVFKALGFRETGRSRHAGYDRDTSITFTMPV